MKILSILLFVVFLFACGGGNSLKKTPDHLLAGTKETIKGTAWYNKGCYKRSLEHFFKAHELFAASDQLGGVAMSMNNIGNIYRAASDLDSAILFFDESFAVYAYINDDNGALHALSNKAATLIECGMLDKSLEVLSAAENLAAKNDITFVPLLSNKAILLTRKKELKLAEEVLNHAITNTSPKNPSEFATVSFAFGNLMLETKKYKKALKFFNQALEADRKAGFHKGIADDLASLGDTCLSLEEYKNAVNFYKRSIKIYALLGNENKVNEIMKQLDGASQKSNIDITLTQHFVDRWLAGDILYGLCE